jgi:hypothetical protein
MPGAFDAEVMPAKLESFFHKRIPEARRIEVSDYKIFGAVVKQLAGFAQGTNTDFNTGYLVGALSVAHEQWHRTIKSIESPIARVEAAS